MEKIEALHIRLKGFTAFFKHPFTITGTQISLPTPSYSTLLGLIGACAGRQIPPDETRIGFEFTCESTGEEIERTMRLAMDNKGNLVSHREGSGIIKRRIHFRPILDLYLTNLNLKHAFDNPVATPSLGRSQDIAWITFVKEITLNLKESGLLGPTTIPTLQENIQGLLVRHPEWFDNSNMGRTRLAGPVGKYQSMIPTNKDRLKVNMPNLYTPSDAINENDVIYLHQWLH